MTKKVVCELNCNEESENQTLVQVMKWRPKMEGRTNNILMSACRDTIYEWHTPSRKIVYKKTFPDNTIFSMDYSNDGSDYALGFKDFSIRVYDGVKKIEKLKLGGHDNHKVTGHMSKIYAIKYHKDNPKILLSGGWDGNVLIWDLNTESPINIINGPMISGEGLDMNCFGEILTASWRKDNPLQLWDYETLQLKNDIEWNFKEKEDVKASTQLYCCKFSNDFGRYIFAGGSQVNAVKVFDWNGRGLAVIDQLSHAPVTLDSSNDVTKNEQYLAVGGGEGAIRVFKFSSTNQDF
jgi:WD40 repeat protein